MTKPDKRKKRKITIHTLQTIEAMSRWDDDCLEWQGYMINGIYPQVCHAGSMVMVRKLVMQLAGRETPPAVYYKPACDNPRCIRIEHIKVVPSAKHMASMARSVNHNAPTRIASLQKAAIEKRKLTDEQVLEVRLSDETHSQIAQRLGVSRATISKIKNNRARRMVSASINPFAALMR